MPNIIINQKKKKYATAQVKNLRTLYENLIDEYATQKSVVTKIKLNGEEISEKELKNKGDIPVKDVESVELIILTLPEIALNNINNAMEYLDKLIHGVKKSSELFRTRSSEEANKYYIHCIDGLAWFNEVTESIRIVLEEDLKELDFDHKSFVNYSKRLLSLTEEVVDSQSKQDWVMLADLLEYELSPFLEEWRSLLPLFVVAVKKKITSETKKNVI